MKRQRGRLILEYTVGADFIDITTWRDAEKSYPFKPQPKLIRGAACIYNARGETDMETVKNEIWEKLERGKRYRLVLEEIDGSQ